MEEVLLATINGFNGADFPPSMTVETMNTQDGLEIEYSARFIRADGRIYVTQTVNDGDASKSQFIEELTRHTVACWAPGQIKSVCLINLKA